MSESTAVVKYEEFALSRLDAAQAAEIVTQNVGPHGFDQFDLERIKIPGGGGLAWELPTLDGEPDVAKVFEGIIIGFMDCRRYWEASFDETGGGVPPDCYSDDGFTGFGNPGGKCEQCPLAKFGSAVKPDGAPGKGQRCGQIRLIFVLRRDELIPTVLSLAPTSLKNAKSYFLKLAARLTPYYGVITRFSLEADQSSDGHKYSKCRMAMALKLNEDQTAQVKSMQIKLEPNLKKVRAMDEDFHPDE